LLCKEPAIIGFRTAQLSQSCLGKPFGFCSNWFQFAPPQDVQEIFNSYRERYSDGGFAALVRVVRRIVAGERNPEALCEEVDLDSTVVVETILAALADPSALPDLLLLEMPGV
jgi:hypothetical protein